MVKKVSKDPANWAPNTLVCNVCGKFKSPDESKLKKHLKDKHGIRV